MAYVKANAEAAAALAAVTAARQAEAAAAAAAKVKARSAGAAEKRQQQQQRIAENPVDTALAQWAMLVDWLAKQLQVSFSIPPFSATLSFPLGAKKAVESMRRVAN